MSGNFLVQKFTNFSKPLPSLNKKHFITCCGNDMHSSDHVALHFRDNYFLVHLHSTCKWQFNLHNTSGLNVSLT